MEFFFPSLFLEGGGRGCRLGLRLTRKTMEAAQKENAWPRPKGMYYRKGKKVPKSNV